MNVDTVVNLLFLVLALVLGCVLITWMLRASNVTRIEQRQHLHVYASDIAEKIVIALDQTKVEKIKNDGQKLSGEQVVMLRNEALAKLRQALGTEALAMLLRWQRHPDAVNAYLTSLLEAAVHMQRTSTHGEH